MIWSETMERSKSKTSATFLMQYNRNLLEYFFFTESISKFFVRQKKMCINHFFFHLNLVKKRWVRCSIAAPSSACVKYRTRYRPPLFRAVDSSCKKCISIQHWRHKQFIWHLKTWESGDERAQHLTLGGVTTNNSRGRTFIFLSPSLYISIQKKNKITFTEGIRVLVHPPSNQ